MVTFNLEEIVKSTVQALKSDSVIEIDNTDGPFQNKYHPERTCYSISGSYTSTLDFRKDHTPLYIAILISRDNNTNKCFYNFSIIIFNSRPGADVIAIQKEYNTKCSDIGEFKLGEENAVGVFSKNKYPDVYGEYSFAQKIKEDLKSALYLKRSRDILVKVA